MSDGFLRDFQRSMVPGTRGVYFEVPVPRGPQFGNVARQQNQRQEGDGWKWNHNGTRRTYRSRQQKRVDKLNDKPSDKPNEKPSDKSSEKLSGKPSEKRTEKGNKAKDVSQAFEDYKEMSAKQFQKADAVIKSLKDVNEQLMIERQDYEATLNTKMQEIEKLKATLMRSQEK